MIQFQRFMTLEKKTTDYLNANTFYFDVPGIFKKLLDEQTLLA